MAPQKQTPVSALPNRIREWRFYRKMTAEDLAQQLGVTKATISRFETGERSFDMAMLQRIAYILGVSASDLMPGRDGISPDERDIVEAFRATDADGQRAVLTVLRKVSGRDVGGLVDPDRIRLRRPWDRNF